MKELYKFLFTLLFLTANMVSFVTHGQIIPNKYCGDPPPQSINITTNSPSDTICGSSQWAFEVDYTDGDLYEWKILDPTLGSIVAGMYTPVIEVMFNNPPGKARNVQIIVAVTRCKVIKRDTLTMHIRNLKHYKVTSDATKVCAGEAVKFTISPDPINYDHLTWGFGDGSQSQEINAIHSYPNSDTVMQYKPVITVVNPEGCLATAVFQTNPITVNPAPTALLSPAGFITGCGSISNTLTATITNQFTDITNYDWYGPPVSNLPYCTNCSTWDIDKFEEYHVVVEDANGCKGVSNTVSVIEHCKDSNCPEIALKELKTSILECGIAEVNIKYTPNKSKITKETWTFPDEAINTRFSTGINAKATASFAKPGVYPISYSVETDSTCLKIFDQTVYIPFIGNMRYEVSCDSGSVYNILLYDHSLIFPKEEGHIRYTYAYKEGGRAWKTIEAPGNAQSVKVQLSAGNYQLRQIIKSNISPFAPPCTTLVDLNLPAKPVADFEFTSPFKPGCVGEVAVHFNNLSSPEAGLNYVWNFGDGTTNFQPNTDKVFSDYGGSVYSVSLTATNKFGCLSTVDQYVRMEGNSLWDGTIKPDIVEFPAPPHNSGDTITLHYFNMMYGIPSKFVWYKGNKELTSGVNSQRIEVTEPGFYWVMGSDENGCSVPSYPVEVIFNEKPNPAIPPNDSLR